MRRLAKTGIALGLRWSGIDHWVGAATAARRQPLVVGYHRVVDEAEPHLATALPGMVISRRMLEHHLEWIGERYDFVSLDELGARLEAGEPSSRPVAAVTFDDGYSDVYHNALPILRRRRIPAAVFVVTDLVGTASVPLYDRLYLVLAAVHARGQAGRAQLGRILTGLEPSLPEREVESALARDAFAVLVLLLDRLSQDQLRRVVAALEVGADSPACLPELRPLGWDMVLALRDAGLTIGSHTRSHALLTHENPERVREELVGSRTTLEARLGTPVRHFAYPDGRWNGAVVASVAAAGYHFAYTVCTHRDPACLPLTIPRRMLWEGSCLDAFGRFSAAMMSCQANGVFDLVTRCAREHAWSPRMACVATPART